jgi:hypothetical protein
MPQNRPPVFAQIQERVFRVAMQDVDTAHNPNDTSVVGILGSRS